MRIHDSSALDSLENEWKQLDAQVQEVVARDEEGGGPPGGRERDRKCVKLLLRLAEARASIDRARRAPPAARSEALHAAEVAVETLFHALWFVDHRNRETFGDATGAHHVRPVSLVARSLDRRLRG